MISNLQFAGPTAQIMTTVIAVVIASLTYRHQRRQNILNLINQNNALANLVNTTIIQCPDARGVLGRAEDCIVGCPDDAILFLYLNYVHNTFRTYRIGIISRQVWTDTLAGSVGRLQGLSRDQVERLLARGYERAFQTAILAAHAAAPRRAVVTPHRPQLVRMADAAA